MSGKKTQPIRYNNLFLNKIAAATTKTAEPIGHFVGCPAALLSSSHPTKDKSKVNSNNPSIIAFYEWREHLLK